MLNQTMFPSKSGGGGLAQFKVVMPKNQGESRGWQRTVRVLDPMDPWFFCQHRFQVRGQWFYLYCLGSPADGWRGHTDDFALDAAGVAQCESIMVPGTGRTLHQMDDGGEIYFNMLVWEWDSNSVKVLSHKVGGSLYPEIVRIDDILRSNGGDLTTCDIVISTEPGNGVTWNFNAMPLPTARDLNPVMAEISAQLQPPEDPDTPWVQQLYNPLQTRDNIAQLLEKKLGAGGQAPAPQAAAPQQQAPVVPNTTFNAGFNPPAIDTSFNPAGFAQGSVQPLEVPQTAPQTQQPPAVPGLLAGLRNSQ